MAAATAAYTGTAAGPSSSCVRTVLQACHGPHAECLQGRRVESLGLLQPQQKTIPPSSSRSTFARPPSAATHAATVCSGSLDAPVSGLAVDGGRLRVNLELDRIDRRGVA